MRLIVDQDLCCGAGQCAASEGDVFDQRDEDGDVSLLTRVPPPDGSAKFCATATACPASVITLVEDR